MGDVRAALALLTAICGCTFDAGGPSPDRDIDAGPDDEVDAATSVTALCPPADALPGDAVVVTNPNNLANAVGAATTGDTIALAAGTYDLSTVGTIELAIPGVTIRSETGERDSVTVTGAGSVNRLFIVSASDVVVEHMTLRDSSGNAILVEPGGLNDITGVRLHDLAFVDHGGGDVSLKARGSNSSGPFADNGEVTCSDFAVTSGFHDTACVGGGNAIDADHVRGWQIRGNTFRDQYCETMLERTISFEGNSRDIVIADNTFIDSPMNIFAGDNGIPARLYVDTPPAECGATILHWGGAVCNNVIVGLGVPPITANTDFEEGVALWRVCDTWVAHNTIVTPGGGETFSTIEYRFSESYVHVVNNLLTQGLNDRGGSLDPAFTDTDVIVSDTSATFVDVASDNVHLSAGAVVASGADISGIAQLDVCASTDRDGVERDPRAPTPGAFEAP